MCIVYIRFGDRSCRGSSSECVYTGTTVQMIQFNTEAVVPFFVSSKGYGLLWDQYSASYLNPPSESERLNFKASPQMPGPGGSIADGTPAQLVSCHDDPRQGAFPACLQMSVSTPCCCLCLLAESFHLRLRRLLACSVDVLLCWRWLHISQGRYQQVSREISLVARGCA